MNIYLELFGYFGSALVILSMMMTSVLKLRIINMSGALVSLIYAICVETWPVAVLNACLLIINFVQTIRRLQPKDTIIPVQISTSDSSAKHLFDVWKADFEKCNPDCDLQAITAEKTHILYVGEKAIGFSISAQNDEQNQVEVLYLIPQSRTPIIKECALKALAEQI